MEMIVALAAPSEVIEPYCPSRLLEYWFDGQKSPTFQAKLPLAC
jgi:hypothetical protein